jgi:hypothetical protein
METLQRAVEAIREFIAMPNTTTGIEVASSTLILIGDYIGLIVLAIIIIGIWTWSKKFKAAQALAKTGFQGMIVSKAFINKKNQTIKVMGLNINGLGLGDIVAFDKDPFQTKCKVGALNLIANNSVQKSWDLSTGKSVSANVKSLTLTDLFNIAKKGIQAVQNKGSANAPLVTITNDDANGNPVPFSPAQDIDVKFTVTPAPVSNEMIVLEFGNPTEFSRLLESQAIGQGNKKVLKAKDLKLVLREKAKMVVASGNVANNGKFI